MRSIRLLFVMIALPAMLLAQKLSDAEREILTLQDQRSLGNGKLISYFASPDPRLRMKALIALACIQDTSASAAITSMLNDQDSRVRAAASFALGQTGPTRYQDSLLSHLAMESDTIVVTRMMEALGKIGTATALEAVIEFKNAGGSPSLSAAQALSVARFALRGIKNERSIWFCFEQLHRPDADVRWKALFALWRTAPHGLIDIEIAKRESLLTVVSKDPNSDVRLNLVTMLGRSKSDYAMELVKSIQADDRLNPDWEVEVQLVRAIAAFSASAPEKLNEVIGYLASPNDHVKIATLQALSGFSKQAMESAADTASLRGELLRLTAVRNPSADLVRGEAMVALAKLFPEDFSRKNYMSDKDLSVREKTKVIEALSSIPSGRSLSITLFLLDDPNVRVAMAAWDFIRRYLTPSTIEKIRSDNQEWGDAKQTLYRKTMNALTRKDMAITHLVSNALADTTFFSLFRDPRLADSLVLALKDAYVLLSSPDDVEAMQAAAAAMGSMKDPRFVPVLEKSLNDPDKTVAATAAAALRQITKNDYSGKIPKSTRAMHTDYDWPVLESLSQSARAVIKTNKGTFSIRLLKDDAPFTVLNFVKLARKNFYNGLSFHRVVPNFVVQGGDPRGDGWGGPGYAIRSEFGFASFERGAAGIASAGKDTEGCQFFITHQPTPHLDGRYTVFGRVTDGQDVVDQIQIGDIIQQITIE
ncbi:MAG: peptidylprolyl isomerase [Ignavibacteriales bacterium]|nr:peptidylprolyl isomerase [Ignavibacteriales bacterium]